MAAKTVFYEFLWLLGISLASFLFAFSQFGNRLFLQTVDIHISDTFFIVNSWEPAACLFLLLAAMVYFFRAKKSGFKYNSVNMLFLLSGLLLAGLLYYWNLTLASMQVTYTGGWVTYPPLAAMGQVEPGIAEDDLTTKSLIRAFTALQAIILVVLLYASFRWGRARFRQTGLKPL